MAPGTEAFCMAAGIAPSSTASRSSADAFHAVRSPVAIVAMTMIARNGHNMRWLFINPKQIGHMSPAASTILPTRRAYNVWEPTTMSAVGQTRVSASFRELPPFESVPPLSGIYLESIPLTPQKKREELVRFGRIADV